MSYVLCKKHGSGGMVETCLHLDETFRRGIYPECYKVDFGISWLLVCAECWTRYNLEPIARYIGAIWDETPPDVDMQLEQAFEQRYREIERWGWCSQCVAQVKVEYARSCGQPDPFPVFERTLNCYHQEKLDGLRQHLIRNFHFADVRPYQLRDRRQDSHAVFVWPGAYTYPLRVQVYYVTDDFEQEKIVQLVDDFLQHQQRNQVRIEFYEAENWQEWHDPKTGLGGGKQGVEVLLTAVQLNC